MQPQAGLLDRAGRVSATKVRPLLRQAKAALPTLMRHTLVVPSLAPHTLVAHTPIHSVSPTEVSRPPHSQAKEVVLLCLMACQVR